jgi:hypothetical protein
VVAYVATFFFVGLGFELRASQLQSRHSALEPHLQPILLGDLGDGRGSLKRFARGLAWNQNPLDLSFPRS